MSLGSHKKDGYVSLIQSVSVSFDCIVETISVQSD